MPSRRTPPSSASSQSHCEDAPACFLQSSLVRSTSPGQGERPELAADRGHVLERPLLADLAVVGDPIDVDGVPPDVSTARRDPKHVAGLGGGDDEPQRDAVAARDRVLLLRSDVRERADEGTEQSDDVVYAGYLCDRRAMPQGIRGEEVPRPLWVLPVEDFRHEPPGHLDPLVDRQRLTHLPTPPSSGCAEARRPWALRNPGNP